MRGFSLSPGFACRLGQQPTDARLALVVLTPRGAEVAAEARVTAEEAAGRALGRPWSPGEREVPAPLLRRASAGETLTPGRALTAAPEETLV